MDEVIDWCEESCRRSRAYVGEREKIETAWQGYRDRLRAGARSRFGRDVERDALRRQAADWQLARQVRAICTVLRDRVGPDETIDPRTAAWIAWATAHAEQLDPLAGIPVIPPVLVPAPQQLAPYLAETHLLQESESTA